MSAIVPPPIESAGAAKKPAKKRQIMMVAMFWERAQPIVNRAASGRLTRYTIERPKVSLKGAASTGPNESPRQYIEIPSNDTVVETPNLSATSAVPEE